MGGSDAATNWTRKHTAGGLATVAGIVLVALLGAPLVISWFFYMLLMAAFTAIVADGITDSKVGILIDERNRMSLSRLQMALWSLLTISAFLAAAISNIRAGAPRPLEIGIPEAIWMLMGITTTSLVGSPLVLSAKRGPSPTPSTPMIDAGPADTATTPAPPARQPMPPAAASVLRAQGEDPSRMSVDGSVVIKHSVRDANWADLFKGDEVADVATLDLAKIQMFFFTVVLVLSYAIALGAKFNAIDAAPREPDRGVAATAASGPVASNPRWFDQFPALDMGFVTILGISNAGFLVNRAIPRDSSAPPAA